MTEIKNLYERIESEVGKRNLKEDLPEYISSNLKLDPFEWNKDALNYFLAYNDPKNGFLKKPTHLMFNMATGSGKTLLMAATILYYYKQGYRHFIFFVNQNNIVDKTENNFINSSHTKYLYKDKVVIDNKTILIKKVENFSDNPDGIEIKFTTIQKLYNDIHLEKENKTTLSDLNKKDIVMLADEAHHLNAETKNNKEIQEELMPSELTGRTSDVEIERKGWEHTVIQLILNKNGEDAENKNCLLEFTATIPANEQIAKKYEDKIIYKFGLKEFLGAGYTKEINLVSSTLDKKDRILQALLFQWYRHKIAIKNGIANFKPVILFRSKTIEESKEDYQDFLDLVENLKKKDFDFLKSLTNKVYESKDIYEQGKSRTEQVLKFIQEEKIVYPEIVEFIKNNFSEKNIIITNSKTNKTKTEKTSEDQEKLLNNLEDKNNHIRAIFTVDRLTEGWDVLNLFDIVRLYQGQNAGGSTNKTPEATTKEKQLIGRGVRYFPFEYNDKLKNKRKFDDDLGNELRILEELFYYTYDEESRYISHLKAELKRDGYLKDDSVKKTFQIKEDFKKKEFYKKIKIWKNKRIDNPERKKKSLKDLKREYNRPYKIKEFRISEQIVEFEKIDSPKRQNQVEQIWSPNFSKPFKWFYENEKNIVQKAINIKAKQEGSLFNFEKLSKELEITSIDELKKSEFLGDFKVDAILNKNQKYEDVSSKEKLNMILHFLDCVSSELKEEINPKIGTLEFSPYSFKELFGEPKTKIIDEKNQHDEVAEKNKWYILDGFVGTDEEQDLIRFIEMEIKNIEGKYEEVYLLRNEEVYTIYDFKKGRGFCPDFILFLRNGKKESEYYQVFIEPKGDWALGNDGTLGSGKDGWKQEFLEQISEEYGAKEVLKFENVKYRMIGLPFFNMNHNENFKKGYDKLLD